MAIALTVLLAPVFEPVPAGTNVVSRVPSTFILAILFLTIPFTSVKLPPIIILPSL
jgi:hypothetical protein